MSKNMNKRFFAEFLALLSLKVNICEKLCFYISFVKVNPDPDVSSDPEIDILKQISDNDDAPSASPSGGKFPDDSSLEFYDEEESGKIVLT